VKRPGENKPDPVGGRAAERLREFLRERLPEGMSPEEINPQAEQRISETQTRSELENQPEKATPPDNLDKKNENSAGR
jgi:hypothetical protein